MSGVQRSASNVRLTTNKHRATTKILSAGAGSNCDSMEDRRASRNNASDASKSNEGTGHALGIEKRKNAKCIEAVHCATERPVKTRRTIPSVTGTEDEKVELISKPRDRNTSSTSDELDEDDTLSPELKELARVVGSQGENGTEWNLDWQSIYQEASPELKALIDSNTKEASLKKNCRKNTAMFRSDPRYCLIKHGNQMQFKSYSEKFRNSTKGPDYVENMKAIKEAPLVKPQRHRKQWTSVLEGRVCDNSAPSQVKARSIVPTREAHYGSSDDGVTPGDGNVIAPDIMDRRHGDASMAASHTTLDGLGDKESGLPAELLELVRIVESQTTKGKGTTWDWDYILSQASDRLHQFIASKRKKAGLSRRSIVGEAMLPSFESFHARIRQERLVRDIANACREEPKEVENGPSRGGTPVTVQADQPNDRQDVTTASECSLISHTLKGVSAAATGALQLKHLTIELRELAALVATSKGHGWAYIESKASPRLKSFIGRKARADPAYISAPLRCLVPTEYFDDFKKLVERNKVGATSDLVCSDADSGHHENRKQGNRRDRKLGQVFALERKSRIKVLTSNLRAELRAFEAQELHLWDSFLQGNDCDE